MMALTCFLAAINDSYSHFLDRRDRIATRAIKGPL
jgi:hypothetical protein